MSVRGQALKYTATALAVAAFIIAASTLYIGPMPGSPGSASFSSTGQHVGNLARLIIQITDPPVVPRGTSSLNLTYSSINLIVSEPTSIGGQSATTEVVTPSGGSATLDLLTLENILQTIASASLPNGSTIYSFTFTVTSASIAVNRTQFPLTLLNGSTVTVTLAQPVALSGTSIALLQLSPVVVGTPSGYYLIPSAVGIVRPAAQGESDERVGYTKQLTVNDENLLEHAQGNVTAMLAALSVSGNVTTITVQVKNTGYATVVLNAIGLHGNFTTSGRPCAPGRGEPETTTESGGGVQTTTTTIFSCPNAKSEVEHLDEVVFVPVNSTLSGAACAPLRMQLVTGDTGLDGGRGLVLTEGQCVDLTFSGVVSFGGSGVTLVPSTATGQVYLIHVIASNGANLQLSCALPVAATSCSPVGQGGD